MASQDARGKRPRRLQLSHIGGIDLIKLAVSLAVVTTTPHNPVSGICCEFHEIPAA